MIKANLMEFYWFAEHTLVMIYSYLHRNALFCMGFQGYYEMFVKCILWQISARNSRLLLPVSSRNGSKTGCIKDLRPHYFHTSSNKISLFHYHMEDLYLQILS